MSTRGPVRSAAPGRPTVVAQGQYPVHRVADGAVHSVPHQNYFANSARGLHTVINAIKGKAVSHAEYEVALSFAGEDREYVADVAAELQRAGVKVFYDKYEKASLWGRDLYGHLSDVYSRASEYTVIFISEHYARKLWPNHERRSAQSRALGERREYILPARFDDTEVPGILPTTGYVDLRELSPRELAALLLEKLGRQSPQLEAAQPVDRDEILSVLVKVQSRQAPLAECIATAFAIAQRCRAAELADFCSNELVGYLADFDEAFMAERSFRAMPAYCTPGRLNLNAFSYRGVSPFTYIEEHPDQFIIKSFFIAHPIAWIEAQDAPKSPGGCFVLQRTLGDFNASVGEHADVQLHCYARPNAYREILEGVRAELTRRLTELVTLSDRA